MIDMRVNPRTEEAADLFLQGSLALARAEMAGIHLDVPYCERQKRLLTNKINQLEDEFKQTTFYRHWEHSVNGVVNINSDTQLRHFLYDVKKYKISKYTYSGQGATDAEALSQLGIPELDILAQRDKLKRLRDVNIDGFLREQVNGVIHPFFNLHLAHSYRSCIAKGTLVLVVRDFLKYPKGVPIEEIKEGNFVYCFDDKLNPAIRKVLWAGKTGHREVIRVHYSVKGKHKNGYLDVTPEHLIRLIDGNYEEAQNLVGDFRKPWESNKLQKIRTLSCARVDDKLNFTGHLKSGKGIHEHRLIYKELIGELTKKDIIHHENEIHLDHTPSNLKKTNLPAHSSYHSKNVSEKRNQERIQTLKDNRYKIIYKSGFENSNSLKLSKFSCYRLLIKVFGHLTKVVYDFESFKKCLEYHNIDFRDVLIRFDKNGNYIWKSKLKEISKLGRAKVSKIIGCGSERLIKLYGLYNIDTKRKWGNQFGSFVPGNHNITKIEWIKKIVDVYDIEVEEFHNFFANEICVHNSSNSPNFQNIPIRDEESMKVCRKALYPRPGHQLLEVDFKAIEVAVNASINKDTNLLKYCRDPKSDMHGDMAKQIFKLDKFDAVNHDILRQATKNGFVFPEFYGDYYVNCAENMACNWGKLGKGRWKEGEGIPLDGGNLSDHLISKGFISLKKFEDHIQKIEKDFWQNRFPEYDEWKDRWYNIYKKYGYFDIPTGFRCSGVLDKKQVCNIPAQGCLQGDVKVFTINGFVAIKELVNIRTKIWTGFNWAEAIGLNKGECQLAEIELNSGVTIKCDIRHRLKNENNEWVDFSDLKIGNYVALPKNITPIEPSKEMNWAFIFGFIIGDGCLYSQRDCLTIVVGIKKKPILKQIQSFLIKQGYRDNEYGGVRWKIILSKGNKNEKYFLSLENKKFASFLKENGFIFGWKSHTKRVPSSVWKMTLQEQRDFMEGLWKSDGARAKWAEYSLNMVSIGLLKDVQILTSALGFDSILTNNKILRFHWKAFNAKSPRKYPIKAITQQVKNVSSANYNVRNQYILDYQTFSKFKKGRMCSQYVGERIIERNGVDFEIYRYDYIKSIKILDRIEPTYTMSVNDVKHQFVADGVIHKNSAFHCLLWSFIQTDMVMRKEKWDSRLIGQIHDCMILDALPSELNHVTKTIETITTKLLPEAWKWLIVPMMVKMEIAPVDKPWSDKAKINF
jgi:intein/homing endonuclease